MKVLLSEINVAKLASISSHYTRDAFYGVGWEAHISDFPSTVHFTVDSDATLKWLRKELKI